MEATEFKPHAYITICNHGGLEIMLNRSNDGVYYKFTGDETIGEAEILYSGEGEAYFMVGECQYNLGEAMRY